MSKLPPCNCSIGNSAEIDPPFVCQHTKGEVMLRHNLVTQPLCSALRLSDA